MSGYVSGFDHHKIVSQFTKLLKEDKLTTSNTETQAVKIIPFLTGGLWVNYACNQKSTESILNQTGRALE